MMLGVFDIKRLLDDIFHIGPGISPRLKEGLLFYLYGWLMVFNATFNNISVISWRSVLLMEETGVPGENHRPSASHRQTLAHNVVSSTSRHERDSTSQS
jgi:hypothetical protein